VRAWSRPRLPTRAPLRDDGAAASAASLPLPLSAFSLLILMSASIVLYMRTCPSAHLLPRNSTAFSSSSTIATISSYILPHSALNAFGDIRELATPCGVPMRSAVVATGDMLLCRAGSNRVLRQ
jgi:hypothetical protein